MEYTINKLAVLAGVTSRTLRYYDEIDLLKPARMNESGYRVYGKEEVDRLQQILFYRALEVDLESIKKILSSTTFDEVEALKDHREQLLSKRAKLNQLINNVDKTIESKEGRRTMSDQEKFEGLKEQLIEENEKQYGKEIREKYGDETVDASNVKMKKLSQEEFTRAEKLGEEILDRLEEAFETGDPTSDKAQKVAALHREWLSFYWATYSKEAHAGVAQMYVDDERFTAYYDKRKPGLAVFLRDAIHMYTGVKSE
ncbi:MerR family transcriptional regulator [Bacillus coahuilensis]|uniref:MerR family transcriptional regulator n=1 Tax=Bacillus coahuilensis TaxID=408580 RepID=UPI00018513A8|nr:MerR family transcriptional regulator [Bacillus coahuilensis]